MRVFHHLHKLVRLFLVSRADVEGEDLIEVVILEVGVGVEAQIVLQCIYGGIDFLKELAIGQACALNFGGQRGVLRQQS